MFIFDFTNFKAKEYFFTPIIAVAEEGKMFFNYLRTINKKQQYEK